MTATVGIIGHPIGHSLSPVFQNAAFSAAGVDALYEAWDTEPAELAARIQRLREPACLGGNVTVPYKREVCRLVDDLDPEAAGVGAINTIVNRSGRLQGFNTDGPGFVRALREHSGFEPRGRSFLLLGAGGAARGIAFGLAAAGAGSVAIANRTPERAAALAGDIGDAAPHLPVRTAGMDEPPRGYDCVVNCTTAGMAGGGAERESPCDPGGAARGTLCVDIVYAPAVTPFLRLAAEAGLPTLGGLPMLIHQGALAFELWTGIDAPTDVMFRAAEEALAGRGLPGPAGSSSR